MNHRELLVCCLSAALLLVVAASDRGDQSGGPAFANQSEGAPSSPGIAPQSGDAKSLEIAPQDGGSKTTELAPQNGSLGQGPNATDASAGGRFGPSEDLAALNRNFHPHREFDGRAPYVGIRIQYTTQCYLGMEEHGLEVLSVHRDSPAAQAGLTANEPPSALGAIGAVGATMLGPVTLFVTPLLERAGALGHGGDLIVAIDDRRVRSIKDYEYELRELKPGDTMYLTVVRPLPGGAHKSMKIAIKVGPLAYDQSLDGPPAVPRTIPSGGAESYAY